MTRKRELEVEVTYTIVSDEEFARVLQVVKNWYVEEFTKWFINHLNQLSIEKQKANSVENINEHIFDNCFT